MRGFKAILKMTFLSLYYRRVTSFLCLLSIGFSIALIIGVDKTRHGAREGFTSTVSGADLLVGARTGEIQLLLYSLFHMGEAVNNIRYSSYQEIASHRAIAWTIPFSLGDSYKGHRVIGTTQDFFKHYQYRDRQNLELNQGRPFGEGIFEVVLGHQVARKHDLKLGDNLIIAHGLSEVTTHQHDNLPFEVVGILAPTATPIDHGLFVSLKAIEAIHIGWETGVPNPDKLLQKDQQDFDDIEISQLTSFLVGAHNRAMTLQLRRTVSQFEREPLMAIIPALTLGRLWETLGQAERVLLLISFCVLIVGLISIIIALYTSLNERRREMAVLRSLGATPIHLLCILLLESFLLVFGGIVLGYTMLLSSLAWLIPYLESTYSLSLDISFFTTQDTIYVVWILGFSLVIGLIPGIKAYHQSLQDGLSTTH